MVSSFKCEGNIVAMTVSPTLAWIRVGSWALERVWNREVHFINEVGKYIILKANILHQRDILQYMSKYLYLYPPLARRDVHVSAFTHTP